MSRDAREASRSNSWSGEAFFVEDMAASYSTQRRTPGPCRARCPLSTHWCCRRQVDRSASVAEKRTPEIVGGIGGGPAGAVSWATARPRAAWRSTLPGQAPTFAHVAAGAGW